MRVGWWVCAVVLVATCVLLAFMTRTVLTAQEQLIEEVGRSLAEQPEVWDGVRVGGDGALQLHKDLQVRHAIMARLLNSLSAVVLATVLFLLVSRHPAARSKAAADHSTE